MQSSLSKMFPWSQLLFPLWSNLYFTFCFNYGNFHLLNTLFNLILKTDSFRMLKTAIISIFEVGRFHYDRNYVSLDIRSRLHSKQLLLLKTSSARLQRNNFTSSKKSWKTKNCYAKTSWRCLEDTMETNKIFTGDICI